MSRQRRNGTSVRRGLSPNVIITITIVVVAVVVIGGALLLSRSGDAAPGSADIAAELRNGPDRNTVLEAGDQRVTIVEFLDYQCPACAAYYANITKRLETDYAGRITFVTRNFPLDVHPLAVTAARVAEAAAKQGRYREMYHALYDHYRDWAVDPDGRQVSDDQARAATAFDQYATTIGLDIDRFHDDMSAADVQHRIDEDLAAGQKSGVRSTPTIFVNGERFEPSGDQFADVDRQLRDLVTDGLGE